MASEHPVTEGLLLSGRHSNVTPVMLTFDDGLAAMGLLSASRQSQVFHCNASCNFVERQ